MMSVVFVLAANRTPLMPCHPAIARLLLKEGKAQVRRRTPFTIQLRTQQEPIYTQPVTHVVDTGSFDEDRREKGRFETDSQVGKDAESECSFFMDDDPQTH